MINLHHFVKESGPYKKVFIKEMLCVEYKCPVQTRYVNFWTDTGCLVYCTSGKKIYSSSAQHFEVTPGSIFYMKKGAYTAENFLDEEYCALMFFIPDSFFQDFLYRYENLRLKTSPSKDSTMNSITRLEMDASLETFFHSLLNYFFKLQNISKSLLEIKLDELAVNLFTQPQHQHFAAYLSSLGHDRTTQLKNTVEANFASNLKLGELARLCGMSLSTFKRQFVKLYGEAPGKWLLRRRLQLAQRLLKHSDKTVNEISFQCGFESASHFIRVFRNEFEFTPIQYRENQLREEVTG